MIIIKLNDLKYRYDVYHIFKLFYDNIDFKEESYDFIVDISPKEIKFINEENEISIYKFQGRLKFKEELRNIIFIYLSSLTHKKLPWGTLIGIRPTKKVHQMMDKGLAENEIIETLNKNYFVAGNKAKLCIQVANMERKHVNKDLKIISVYVGMPFCPTRCLYCSFASNPINSCKKLVEPYLKALEYEIDRISEFINKKNLEIECVYFGGGTPTSIEDKEFENILFKIYESFVKGRNVKEFNVECGRPDSINENKLSAMKKYEVNRISINPQSMNDVTLKAIGRSHEEKDIIEKFNLARSLGFDNINMDLIIGLPNEGLEEVRKTCEEIFKLNPDNITVHGMAIKRGSILHEQILLGKIKLIEQLELDSMYDETVKLAEKLRMKPYYMYRQKNMIGNTENVGYSKLSKEGLYNIQMIEEKQTIIALGADAVTKVVFLETDKIERVGNLKDIKEYINRLEEKIEEKLNVLETLYD
ncbi:oxygen-independent coproporphyrinogen-III oxidase-like protein HemZ [Clostridium homopropionicum DSM 5847]|uniref:Oxygen-independent coproporphyrinogen-III oxidase-like protein HemZ n=1 Tax=Clostridium homopropionicum DSM 5847 TaxID=1121318 RepID=A0A0L6ZDL9_9CLOT|nr:coproporphyrinogen III oxidase [Clostridium homopropionicum]KOA21074.1 oxygen-independent coproporphyrinogen-III oxidase-like protein HemZ [Clostridium homopropionicum DSM 5847]SFF97904.1 oxygen-independent coproporphyrinogen-3 oxidase [Clostridium homopropionicum]